MDRFDIRCGTMTERERMIIGCGEKSRSFTFIPTGKTELPARCKPP